MPWPTYRSLLVAWVMVGAARIAAERAGPCTAAPARHPADVGVWNQSAPRRIKSPAHRSY